MNKTAQWMGDQYVVTETGNDWVDESGRPVEDETFAGPRSGESVAREGD